MSSIVFVGGLILLLAIIIGALVSINNNQRKKKTLELASRFNELGEKNYLSFTHKEVIENFIIGLDQLRMKLFALRKAGDQYDFQVIDLKEIRSCSKKKIYKSINMGTVKKENYENYIDKIVLQFDFLDNRDPVLIAFYESNGGLSDIPELERKVTNWITILTDTLNRKLKSTA